MRITDLNIDGFGIWSDLKLDDLDGDGFIGIGDLVDGLVRLHVKRSKTRINVQHTQVVSQVCRDRFGQAIRGPVLEFLFSDNHVLTALGTDSPRLEEQEPCPHWTVSILKPDRDKPDFLTGHLCARLYGEIGAGAGIKWRIPGTPKTFTDRPGTEHVDRTTHGGNSMQEAKSKSRAYPVSDG